MDEVSNKILGALQNIGRPCPRHELAGEAELTIKRLAAPLDTLVELGAVVRLEDGRYALSIMEERRRRAAC